MGEEVRNPQRIAAAAYDYDSDPRWADYWSNVLLPPHMAARSDVVDHYKRKFYQRFIDPDFVVEGISSASSSQTPGASEWSSQSTTQSVRPQGPGSAGSGSGTARTTAATGHDGNSYRLDEKSILFSANAWVLIVALLGMFPLVPRNLSNKAYRLSLLGTACSSAYSLYKLYGKPRAWNLPSIQAWFRTYMDEPSSWVEANGTTLNILSSHVEIALGFLLIASLFSWQRSIIQTIMYWQLLKLMYRAPVTASYHQRAWSNFGRTLNPYIHRYAPFFSYPISSVQRWWFT